MRLTSISVLVLLIPLASLVKVHTGKLHYSERLLDTDGNHILTAEEVANMVVVGDRIGVKDCGENTVEGACPEMVTVPLPDGSQGYILRIADTGEEEDDDDEEEEEEEAPNSSTEPPTTSTESPTTSTESPTTSTESPTTSTESPTTSTESPTTSTESPTSTSTESATSTESSTTSTESTTTSTESPTTLTESPTTLTESPTSTSTESATSTESSTTSTESTTTSSESPTTTSTSGPTETSETSQTPPSTTTSRASVTTDSSTHSTETTMPSVQLRMDKMPTSTTRARSPLTTTSSLTTTTASSSHTSTSAAQTEAPSSTSTEKATVFSTPVPLTTLPVQTTAEKTELPTPPPTTPAPTPTSEITRPTQPITTPATQKMTTTTTKPTTTIILPTTTTPTTPRTHTSYTYHDDDDDDHNKDSQICNKCVLKHGVGYVPHPTDCGSFYQCISYGRVVKAVEKRCPGRLRWNQKVLTCDYPGHVKCENEDACSSLGDRRMTGNCRGFWDCSTGSAVPKCCPLFSRYDDVSGMCLVDITCLDSCQDNNVGSRGKNTVETSGCHLRSAEDDPYAFEQKSPEGRWVRQKCPRLTAFKQANCGCVFSIKPDNVKEPKKECRPELLLDFDIDAKDTSGRSVPVENNGVRISNGMAYFDGASSLMVHRFANAWFGQTVVVSVRYHQTESRERQGLVCNGDCDIGASLYLGVGGNGVGTEFQLKTYGSDAANFTLPSSRGGFQDVTMLLDDGVLEGRVGGHTSKRGTKGAVETRQRALVIGGCEGTAGFTGKIDRIALYFCRPGHV